MGAPRISARRLSAALAGVLLLLLAAALAPQAAQAQQSCGSLSAPMITSISVINTNQVNVAWGALSTGQNLVGSWEVQWRKTGATNWRTRTLSDASARGTGITGLDIGTTYQVRVRANHQTGTCPPGGFSTIATTTTPHAPVLTVTPGNGQVSLSWTWTRGLSALPGSWVYRRKQGSGNYGSWLVMTGGGSARSFTVTGLNNGTAYTFQIARRGTPPPGAPVPIFQPYSNEVPATPMAPPEVLPELSFSRANDSGNLSAEDFNQNACPRPESVTADEVEEGRTLALHVTRSTSGTETIRVDFEILTTSVAKAADLASTRNTLVNVALTFPQQETTRCHYLDIAKDTKLEGDETLSIRIKAKPSAYTIKTGERKRDITIKEVGGALRLRHKNVGTLGSTPATRSFNVTLEAGIPPTGPNTNPNSNPATCDGFVRDTTFTRDVTMGTGNPSWRVRDGSRPDLTSASLQDFDFPGTVSFKSGVATATITAKADADRNSEDFRIDLAPQGSQYPIVICEPTAVMAPGFSSGPSGVIPSSVPAAPTGLGGVVGDSKVTLSWDNPNNASITGYDLSYSKVGESWSAWDGIDGATAATTSQPVTNLENGSQHRFRIRAMNSSGVSDPSAVFRATPKAAVTSTISVPSTLTVAEGAGTVTVTISAPGLENLEYDTLTFNVSYGSTASTSDADATGASDPASGDYDNDAVTLVTFSPPDATKNIVIPITDDAVDEANETFTVTIAASGTLPEGFTLGNATTTVTITDDDTAGVTVSTGTLTVAEGGSNTYTVVLDTQPTADVTVTMGGASGDVSVQPLSLTFTPQNYGTAQTVTVSAAEDPDATTDANVTLTHSASGGDYGSVDIAEVVVSVTENDTAGVTVSTGTLTVAEGGSNTYTVVLDTQPTADVTVTMGGASGDVSVQPLSLTFTPQNYGTAQTVTVSAAEDPDATTDANVTLTHSASGGDYGSVDIAEVVVSVTENDTAGVTVSTGTLTVAEGGSNTYTVVLDTQPTADVTVTVGGASGDVSVQPLSLTFTPQNYGTAQTVTVSAAEDPDAATDANVTLTHSASGGDYGSVDIAEVVVSVTENDTAGVTVSTGTLTVAEGGSNTYTVVLDTQPTADVTVTVGGASGDVSVQPLSLTFTPQNYGTAQTVTVSAAEDPDAATDSNVTLTHSASGGDYGSVDIAEVVVSVTENDTAGVTVTPTALTVVEGESETWTVVLDTQPTADVTVTVGGASGDVSVQPLSLTFTPQNYGTAQTVTVSAAEDDDTTTDADVTLTHSASGGDYGSVSIAEVVVSVTENDTAGVAVTPTVLTVVEGGSNTYTVRLSTQPTADVTVTVGGASGDVSVQPLSLTFTPQNYGTAQTVTVSAAEDPDATTDANVMLTHRASGGDYGSVSIANVVVSVTENDTAGVTVTPVALTVVEGESETWTVVLDTQPTADVTVTVGGASGDVSVQPLSLTFTTTNYVDPQTVTVSAAEDPDATTDAEVTLTHRASGGDYGSVSIAEVVVSVTENDTAGVTVTPTALTVDEGGSNTYTVVLDTQPSSNVTVTVGGASGDVSVQPLSLTFTPQNYGTAQTVTVSAAEDPDTTTDAEVTLTHSASGGGYGSVSIAEVVVSVTENDTAGVTVSTGALTVAEGGSNTYTVVLDTQPTADVTVTVGGTSGDVSVQPLSLTFTPQNYGTAQTVTVSAAEDPDTTTDAEVTLTHSASGGDYGSVSIDSVVVSVTENDAGGVTVSTSALTVAEGGSNTYTVVLDTQPSSNVTVTVGGASGDVSVQPLSLTFTPQNYGTAQTVTVSAAEDPDATTDSNVTLTHSASGGGYGSVSIDSVVVSVTENDTAGVTVTPTVLTVMEGESATWTVVLDTEPSDTVTVTVGGASGDVSVQPLSLTFTPQNYGTAQTVTVSAAEDPDATTDADVTLTHSASGGGYGSVSIAEVVVSVTENDTAGVTVTPTVLTVMEGESATWTVVLDTEPSDTVTVTVGGASGDVTVQPASLTFTSTNWQEAQVVTASAAQDADAVSDAEVTLTHSAVGGGYDSVAIADVVVTVTEDDTAGVTVTPTVLTVMEGESATWTVVLDTQPTADVTVTVGGASGDVTVQPPSLTFTPQNYSTAQTVTVLGVRDADVLDEMATLTHSARGGDYDGVVIDPVRVTVTDTTRAEQSLRANAVNEAVLPQVAAALAAQSLSTVRERIEAVASGRASARLQPGHAGLPAAPVEDGLPRRWQHLSDPDEWWAVEQSTPLRVRELLDGAAFSVPLRGGAGSAEGGPGLGVWGQADWTSLSGSEDEAGWDGGLWSAWLGADLRVRSDWLVGAALSWSEGDLDTALTGSDGSEARGDYETELVSLYPYLSWLRADGSGLWAMAGYGAGEVRSAETGLASHRSDLRLVQLGGGGQWVVQSTPDWIAGGLTRVLVKGEGSLAWVERDAFQDVLAQLQVDVQRLRVALEGAHERAFASGATLTPTLELGVRYDAGDAADGAGLDAGAGLRYRYPDAGLTVEFRVRTLLTHERDRDEWGASAHVHLDPGSDGRGLFLSLTPSRGETTSGLGQLFEHSPTAMTWTAAGPTPVNGRLEAEIGHGFGRTGLGLPALWTPYAGVTLATRGERHWRLGSRYRLHDWLDLDLEAARRDSAVATTEHSLMGRLVLHW